MKGGTCLLRETSGGAQNDRARAQEDCVEDVAPGDRPVFDAQTNVVGILVGLRRGINGIACPSFAEDGVGIRGKPCRETLLESNYFSGTRAVVGDKWDSRHSAANEFSRKGPRNYNEPRAAAARDVNALGRRVAAKTWKHSGGRLDM